jgi:hypothetical protein
MTTFPVADVDKKDPSDVKFYTMDWTNGVNEGATIVTSMWTIETISGDDDLVEEDSDIITGNLITRILLSGGTDGNNYDVTNTITTTDGETLEKTGVVRVRQQ